MVGDGIYNENVNVSKPLTIVSFASTTVQAVNPDDHVFEVKADFVNISGFTITGSSKGAGISIYGQ